MAVDNVDVLIRTVREDGAAILDGWLKLLTNRDSAQGGRSREAESH